MKATSVRYVSGYVLHIIFDDGVEGEIDLHDLVKKGVFQSLQDPALFAGAYLTDHSLAWSEELEIDIYQIYHQISGRPLKEIMSGMNAYTSN
jgi:hypothetical protein